MCSMFAQREEEDPGTADDNERQMMEYLSGTSNRGSHPHGISVPEADMRCSEQQIKSTDAGSIYQLFYEIYG